MSDQAAIECAPDGLVRTLLIVLVILVVILVLIALHIRRQVDSVTGRVNAIFDNLHGVVRTAEDKAASFVQRTADWVRDRPLVQRTLLPDS